MIGIRRSSLARAAPTVGTTLVLLWLTSSTSSGAPLPWAPPLSLELWLGARPAVSGPTALPELAPSTPIPGALPTDLLSPADPLAGRPYASEIRAAAARHGVDPLLLAAIVEVESNFEPDAVSPKGAVGLMQLMPVHFDANDRPFEPRVNLGLGARFLGQLVERFGDLPTALAAYHAGPGAVERAGGQAPYRSTRDYVAKVLSVYGRHRSPARPHLLVRSDARSMALGEMAVGETAGAIPAVVVAAL